MSKVQRRLFDLPEDESNQKEQEQLADSQQESLRHQPHLEVYEKGFLLVGAGEQVERVWAEGKQSQQAQARYQRVKAALEQGFLDEKIEAAKSPEMVALIESRLSAEQRAALEAVVNSVTAQQGRALVEVFVLQLAVKAVCPDQDVRLHKGNTHRDGFSWKEGISMRRLDDSYIGPTLRRHHLLRMNQYGAFMTRTFAENYPYSLFYKAEITGAKRRWLRIVDEVEEGKVDAEAALVYVLLLLWKTSEAFIRLVQQMLTSLEDWLSKHAHALSSVTTMIQWHIEQSEARARLLEVAIHALLQALEDLGADLGGVLKPLMAMRTANLKHGNVGDVEVLMGESVVEAWDAKYDQPYLSDALDELVEKVQNRPVAEIRFGYMLLPLRKTYPEVERKIAEIAEQFGLKVQVQILDEWALEQFVRGHMMGIGEAELAQAWLRAYAESLGLKRREKAPIDEPTLDWVATLARLLAE